jgi:CxxC-x17-CxxC domain-containing protein
MRIFSNDNDKYSGRRKNRYESDNRGRSNRSDRGSVTMYDAVCDECGKDCKVPFRPSGEKPIYCSSCFEKQGNGIPRGNNRDSRDFQNKEMFSAVCDDCGNDCKVPFRPSSDKPIYCSSCFEKRGNSHEGGSGPKSSLQLEEVNEKLDRILKLLESNPEQEIEEVIEE